MIAAIVAVDEDYGIGYQGQLLEHIPEDLKHFKELTEYNIVIMGRNTWESLPKKETLPRLPNRINVIVSNSMLKDIDEEILGHLTVVMTLEKAIDYIQAGDKNVFIIGGGQLYTTLLPYCDSIYLTKIFKKHDNIDTYFPDVEQDSNWQCIDESAIYNYKDLQYQFKHFSRIN